MTSKNSSSRVMMRDGNKGNPPCIRVAFMHKLAKYFVVCFTPEAYTCKTCCSCLGECTSWKGERSERTAALLQRELHDPSQQRPQRSNEYRQQLQAPLWERIAYSRAERRRYVRNALLHEVYVHKSSEILRSVICNKVQFLLRNDLQKIGTSINWI